MKSPDVQELVNTESETFSFHCYFGFFLCLFCFVFFFFGCCYLLCLFLWFCLGVFFCIFYLFSFYDLYGIYKHTSLIWNEFHGLKISGVLSYFREDKMEPLSSLKSPFPISVILVTTL